MQKRVYGLMFALLICLSGFSAAAAQTEPQPNWNGTSRFTVLIMGMDRRPTERSSLVVRTDVMIVASIDPANAQIGLLHLPRDLHLTPAGVTEFKRINTLMLEGETLQPGYGAYYAMDIIQYNLGMYIDRYILFDFDAFESVINAVGGVEITTTYTLNDPYYPDMNYGYDPFYLPAGTHLLDGRNALKYARTRHGDNDFVRGERQMQVIQAIHERIISEPSVLPRLVLQAPQLIEDLSDHIYTDLTVNEMVQLARTAALIPNENIHVGGINQQYNMTYTTPGGTNVYIPDREKLVDLMTNVFGLDYNQ